MGFFSPRKSTTRSWRISDLVAKVEADEVRDDPDAPALSYADNVVHMRGVDQILADARDHQNEIVHLQAERHKLDRAYEIVSEEYRQECAKLQSQIDAAGERFDRERRQLRDILQSVGLRVEMPDLNR